jgi:DNA-binding transcriptional MerR regulator
MALTPDNNLLAIGRFAAATGLSHKALRIYDEMGLLSPSHTDPFTGYRYYEADQVRRGEHIRRMREMEMPLQTIRTVLDAAPPVAETLLAGYEREFNRRSQQVSQMTRRLIHSLRQEEITMTLQVEQRDLAPQQVVSIESHVLLKDLDPFIQDTLHRLAAFVSDQGGRMTGPPLALYHGPINEQDDGPLEVCLPAEGAFRVSGNIRVRELPGGPAVAVRVSGEYMQFPLILQAYDAAHDWIVRNGYEMAESPREIWLGPIETGGPMEVVWRYQDGSVDQ